MNGAMQVKSLKNIKTILEEHKFAVENKFKVKEMSIFGSHVRGEQKDDSDIDILVEFNEPVGFFTFLDLEEFLSEVLETKVDLVSKKALKPGIGKNILQERISV